MAPPNKDEVLAACASCHGTLQERAAGVHAFRCECGDVGAVCATCELACDGYLTCRGCVEEESKMDTTCAAPCAPSVHGVIHTAAHVVESWGEFFVHLEVDGKVVDIAGPFNDEIDANLAALRNSDEPGWQAPAWAKRRQRPVVRGQLST